MNIKKRADDEAEQPQEAEPQATGKKPVVVYIMILFIAAFLLMALSFAMHQRSNTAALGELQHSVSAMQEVQATQEKIIELQDELSDAKDAQNDLEDQLEQSQETLDAVEERLSALTNLYLLECAYDSADYDACQRIIEQMEADHQRELLTIDSSIENVTFLASYNSPDLRYDQLKEAVETALAMLEQG